MIGDYNPLPLFILTMICIYPMWRILPDYGIDRVWAVAAFFPIGLAALLWLMAYRGKEHG